MRHSGTLGTGDSGANIAYGAATQGPLGVPGGVVFGVAYGAWPDGLARLLSDRSDSEKSAHLSRSWGEGCKDASDTAHTPSRCADVGTAAEELALPLPTVIERNCCQARSASLLVLPLGLLKQPKLVWQIT